MARFGRYASGSVKLGRSSPSALNECLHPTAQQSVAADWEDQAGMDGQQRIISVFGSAQVEPGDPAYAEALETGALLATAGFVVCSGGYGGAMEAVSRGASDAGGRVIGVTAHQLFTSRVSNPWVHEEIDAGTFLDRLRVMVEMSQGYLAVKGGIGTLTEISTVWSLLQTRSLSSRPLVMLSDPWQGLLSFSQSSLIVRHEDLSCVQLADSPAQAVELLATALGSVRP